MGLDCSHDAYHGAYSSFNRWRTRVGIVAGYDPELGYEDGTDKTGLKRLDWDAFPEDVVMGVWDQDPEDVLLVLLCHSDCDGVIPARFCDPLAKRLEELLPLLDGDGGGHVGLYRSKTQEFIDGLRSAAASTEDVEFG